MAAVRADPWLVTADVLLAGALLAGSIAAFAGTRITRGIVPRVLEAAGGVAAAACVGTLAILQRAATDRTDAASSCGEQAGAAARLRARLRPWTPVLRGLLLAGPIVVLLALLFASPTPCSPASRGPRLASMSKRTSTTSRPARP